MMNPFYRWADQISEILLNCWRLWSELKVKLIQAWVCLALVCSFYSYYNVQGEWIKPIFHYIIWFRMLWNSWVKGTKVLPESTVDLIFSLIGWTTEFLRIEKKINLTSTINLFNWRTRKTFAFEKIISLNTEKTGHKLKFLLIKTELWNHIWNTAYTPRVMLQKNTI